MGPNNFICGWSGVAVEWQGSGFRVRVSWASLVSLQQCCGGAIYIAGLKCHYQLNAFKEPHPFALTSWRQHRRCDHWPVTSDQGAHPSRVSFGQPKEEEKWVPGKIRFSFDSDSSPGVDAFIIPNPWRAVAFNYTQIILRSANGRRQPGAGRRDGGTCVSACLTWPYIRAGVDFIFISRQHLPGRPVINLPYVKLWPKRCQSGCSSSDGFSWQRLNWLING